MQKDITAVILAAGNGTRMRSKKPKVLHEICETPMLFLIVKEAMKVSEEVVVVLGYEAELVKAALLAEFKAEFDSGVLKVVEQDLQNFAGTGGAVRAAAGEISRKRALVLCGDTPLVKAEELQKLTDLQNAAASVAAFESSNPFGYGRVIVKSSKSNLVLTGEFDGAQIAEIVEEKEASAEQKKVQICNAGAYCFEAEFLKNALGELRNDNASGEFYLTDVVKVALTQERAVRGVKVEERNFLGVNDKAALAFADELMQDEVKEKLMKQGVILHLPRTIYISPKAVFEGECEVESGVVIKGACHFKEAIIKSSSVIEESFVESSDIGPLAHLRAGCVVKNTHIGNFVELKKAHLNGVKAGHLSYLGDCEIGRGSNVGCGTITCNYDGVKKHKTLIGENVFIGSDTQLVAPVKVASNTLIAAGSTVTKDTQEGDLVLSRTKQTNISGGFYKFFKR